jgi:hypothetical protein
MAECGLTGDVDELTVPVSGKLVGLNVLSTAQVRSCY